MNHNEIKAKVQLIEEIYQEFLKSVEVEVIENQSQIDDIRIKYLGKKSSLIQLMSDLKLIEDPDEKKQFGRILNEKKKIIAQQIKTLQEQFKQKNMAKKTSHFDLRRGGNKQSYGYTHPLYIIEKKIVDIFSQMGFIHTEGPEIETEYYNFEALNIPKNHPARNDQDSMYLEKDHLLRTQTSPVQIRILEKISPPVAIVSPGRVYRRDTQDASHSPIFHQIEGLYVNKGLNFTHLKGILSMFCKEMFGDLPLRFRPDYFPFTEPSCEISIGCRICKGKGCSTCSGDGWIEILGAGMVNPIVLSNVGIDHTLYSGIAFGVGIERITMLKYQISDIRILYENRFDFLSQFK